MRLLLDTHIAYWLAADRASLTPAEWQELTRPEHDLFISAVAVWELRLKWSSLHPSGDRKGPIDPSAALTLFEQLDIAILPLEAHIAAGALKEPLDHKDPFDELLLVCAQEQGMKLFTRDKRLKSHSLAVFA